MLPHKPGKPKSKSKNKRKSFWLQCLEKVERQLQHQLGNLEAAKQQRVYEEEREKVCSNAVCCLKEELEEMYDQLVVVRFCRFCWR